MFPYLAYEPFGYDRGQETESGAKVKGDCHAKRIGVGIRGKWPKPLVT